jgi:7SK snRNA methylphosphate capping enzyme
LNSGDEGLKRFFKKVHRVLGVGGSFVLEPQAWDTYKKAKRMDKVRIDFDAYICTRSSLFHTIERLTGLFGQTLKENAQNLKVRPEDFEGILGQIGFGPKSSFGEIGEGG